MLWTTLAFPPDATSPGKHRMQTGFTRSLSIVTITLCCSIFMPALSAQAADYSPVTLTIVAPNGTPLPGVTVVAPGRTGVSGTSNYGQSNLHGQISINDRLPGETLQLEISPRPYVDGSGWQCPNAMSPVKQIMVNPSDTSITVQVDSTLDQVDHPELDAEEQTFIDMVNNARAQLGRSPVHEVARFSQLASVEAAAFDIYKDRISTAKHLGLQCESLQTRETEGGIHIDPAQSFTGEVIAYAANAQVALTYFKDEPLHWAALMRPDITDIGVALVNGRSFVAEVGNGKYTITGPDLVHHRTLPAWSAGGNAGAGTGTGTTTDPGDALSIDRPDTTVVGHRVEITGTSTASSVTVAYNGQQQTVKVDGDQRWSATVKAVQTGTVTATDTTGSAAAKLQVRASIKLSLQHKKYRYTLTGTVSPGGVARVFLTRKGHRHVLTTRKSGKFTYHFVSKHQPSIQVAVPSTVRYLSTARQIGSN